MTWALAHWKWLLGGLGVLVVVFLFAAWRIDAAKLDGARAQLAAEQQAHKVCETELLKARADLDAELNARAEEHNRWVASTTALSSDVEVRDALLLECAKNLPAGMAGRLHDWLLSHPGACLSDAPDDLLRPSS